MGEWGDPERVERRMREIEATGLRWIRDLPSSSEGSLPRPHVELILQTMMTMVRGYLRPFGG